MVAGLRPTRYPRATVAHYSKAPITEAIIDVRASLAADVTLSDIERLGHEGLPDYPNRKSRILTEASMHGGAEVEATVKQTHVGFVYTSLADPYVVQLRLDGFTLSRLAPYVDWGTFRSEAQRLWRLYAAALRPQVVTRLAVRYINRLDVAALRFELGDYLGAFPQLPSGIGGLMSGFVMHLEISQPDVDATLLLNIATAEPTSPELASILLDIDVFREAELRDDDDGIWEILDRLRVRKNEVFESCITQKTRELIA